MNTNAPVLEIIGDDKTLAMPGVRLTATAIEFDKAPSEQTLLDVGHLLQRMRSSLRYWEGDHLKAYLPIALQGQKVEKEKERQLELCKIAEYAEITGQSRDQLAEAEAVARFFPTAARRPGLRFEHHVEAYAGCNGDFLVANAWLDLAAAGAWDVAKLRAHIRGQRAKAAPTGPRPDDVDDAAEIELWAARQLAAARAMTQPAAVERLKALSRTATLIDTLREAARP